MNIPPGGGRAEKTRGKRAGRREEAEAAATATSAAEGEKEREREE